MSRSYSQSVNKYAVTAETILAAKKWEEQNMYKSSYFKQSEKNVIKHL